MNEDANYDAVVVGGSVAGSATAIALATLGCRVAVIERDPAFRDRVRGEGLHPWGVDEAQDLGLLPVLERAGAKALPIWLTYTNRLPAEPYRWADDSARGHAETGVAHPRLQQALLEEAQRSGVTVHRPAAMTATVPTGLGWLVETDTGACLSTRLLIGADGVRSRTRTMLGIGTVFDPKQQRHHLFAGLLISDFNLAEDSAHAGMLPGGRFFILPQGSGRARAYGALMPDRVDVLKSDRSGQSLITLLSHYLPEDALARAKPVGPQGIFKNGDIWPERGSGPMAVLVGDAAGANDPSFGHGISLALRDARELKYLVADFGLSQSAIDRFAERRAMYYGTLRAFVTWMGPLMFEEGEEADARRAAYAAARESDPDAGGFAQIIALGPRDLRADEAARSRLLGEALVRA